ncbi:MAG: hypothetical protein P4L64_10045 [Caulobacteraceae bacterium]|nr:hypothetical protein [Caulobacteraceae bacterium]
MVRGLWALAAAWLAATSVQAASVASPPPPVEDYGKSPGMQNVTPSPSGQRYAFVTTVGGKRMLYVATTDNKPIDAASLGPTKVEQVWWAGDDHLLVAYSNTVNLGMEFTVSKHELGGVVVMDLKHRKTFSVFAGPYQKSVAQTVVGSFGAVEQKGHWYGYFAGYGYEFDRGGGYVKTTAEGRLIADLFKVDLDTGDFTVAVKGQEDVYDWLVSPVTGEVVARVRFNQRNGDWKIVASRWS